MRNKANLLNGLLTKIGLVVGFLISSHVVSAQCGVSILNTSADTLDVACGSTVVLERDTLGAFALFNSFNDGTVGVGWDGGLSAQLDNPCGPKNSTYLWMGPNTANPRVLTTDPLNLSCGGEICFEFKMAVQAQGSPCEGPDLPDEGMALQYQLPGSTAWDTIFYFEPDDNGDSNAINPGAGDWTAWAYYCFPIPPAAQVPNVQLRWSQQAVSGNGFDHWGLDSISVELYCGNITNIWSTGDTGQFITTAEIVSTTPYTLTRIVENVIGGTVTGYDTCYDTLTLVPQLPQVPVNPSFEPFCRNTDAEVFVDFNNAQFVDTSVTYNYAWVPDVFDSSTIEYGIIRGLTADTITVFSMEHPVYPQCNMSDTIEILAGGVEIDSSYLDNPTCFRDPLADLYIYWENEISTPLVTFYENGTPILPPPLDTIFSDLEEGDYRIVLKDERCADTLDFTVSVPDTVDILLNNIDTNICVESPTDQSFIAQNGTAPYDYYFNTTLADTLPLQSDKDTIFAMYAIDDLGCSTDTVYKQFNIPPPIVIEPYDTLVCPNIPFQVTAVASGGLGGPYEYLWSNGDSTATTTLVGEKRGTSYSVSASDGCAETGVMTPQINLIPTEEHTIVREYLGKDPTGKPAPVIVTNNNVLIEEPAPLGFSFKPEPKLIGSTYQWDLWLNGSIADQQYGWPVIPPDSTVDTGFRYAKDGYYEVRLITTTEEGCIDTAIAAHQLNFEGEAPNVITPNGDGINDIFYLPGSEALRDYKMEVYNRWGQKVYESTNPNLPINGGGWDGGDQPDGTYFYVVTGKRGNGSEHVDKGTVTISGSNK